MMKSLLCSVSLVVVVAVVSAPARAGDWVKDHPRRAEVNGRLKNQHKRVKEGVKDGELTKGQANKINRQDRAIRNEERRMAARDGGHITKADQEKLNRQENRVSNEINRDEAANKNKAAHADGSAAPAATPAPAPAP